jgi:pimeloyl-ACP methyl ester carboxylesterase
VSAVTLESDFLAAYRAVLAKWPDDVQSLDAPTPYGATRVHVCGPAGGEPLVLLCGGGATSTVWFGVAAKLSGAARVYAVDLIGDAGLSVPRGRRVTDGRDLMWWLDAVFDHCGLDQPSIAGHSYGAWLALGYATHAPERVRRLALFDPTDCFAGLATGYRLRAVPSLVWHNRRTVRALLRWETKGRRLDADWLRLVGLGHELPGIRLLMSRRPSTERLAVVTAPTLVLLAGRSRVHDVAKVADGARESLPDARVVTLAEATHHTMPTEDADQIGAELASHLA